MIEKKELDRRMQNVTNILKDKNLKAAIIYYDELNIGNGWYLSGWCPQFESGAVLVTDNGAATILGGPESEPFAKMDAAIKNTKNIPAFMVPDEEYPYAEITDFNNVFIELFGSSDVKELGIVGMRTMPYGVYELLRKDLPGVEFIDITNEYEALRNHKSVYEIEQIKKAFSITDSGFKAMLDNLNNGVSEIELAGIGEGTCRKLGANRFGFQTIVAAGERSNGVVPTATERLFCNGEFAMLGLSARYKGYASAAGFTPIVGNNASQKQKDYLKIITEAFLMSRDMLKPGMVGHENYAKIKEYLVKSGGLERYIVCPFIHTVGLHEAESPFYGPKSEDVLKPGMTVCVDTSLFGHPDFAGIRLETGYLITETGYEPMSDYMDNLIEKQLDI